MNSQEQEAIAQAILAAKALGQYHNEQTAIFFAVAMSGLVVMFTLSGWLHRSLSRRFSKNERGIVSRTLYVARSIRGLLLRKIPLFPSFGHAVIFVIYLVINITLCFYHVNWSTMFDFAARLGWMAVCNIALITFLALKNTPLAFLTTYSYERLNCLHQAAGYCTVAFALTHPIVTAVAYASQTRLKELLEPANVMGMVAGSSMLILLISVLVIRKKIYEIFYIMHVSLFVLIIVALSIHRSEITLKALIIVIVAAIMWISDRIIRLTRLVWRASRTSAYVMPLARGGLRIVVKNTASHVRPGLHVFLWIPAIRKTETHPFTIVSTDPLELVVKAHDGFTKDLLVYATEHPNAVLRASIDGPYGNLPDFTTFDQVILLAGGSGASFTFGVALDLISKLGESAKKPLINFVWVVREQENLTWFTKELEILHASPLIQVLIHITHSNITEASSPTATTTTSPETAALITPPDEVLNEKKTTHSSVLSITEIPATELSTAASSDSDIENSAAAASITTIAEKGIFLNSSEEARIHSGRPDIARLIPSMVRNAAADERTVVAVCGPRSLMLATRSAVADVVGSSGDQDVTLHCEQFGW